MKKLIWIVIILIIIWGVWFRGEKPAPIASGEPIKIGALLTLTGDGQAWGENAKKGIELAVEEFKTKNGRSIEVIFEDTHSEAKTAITAYRKLVDLDKVSVIIGPLMQSEASALAPIIATDKIPVVSPAYAPLVNRPDPQNPLFVWMNPQLEAEQMAKYVYSIGNRKVGVIGTKDNWENEISEAFAAKFQELGGQIVGKEIVQPDMTDNRLAVTKILASKPDSVFLGTYYQFVNSIKALSDFNYKGNIFSIEVDQYLADQTKNESGGLQFIAPDFYTSDFVDRFVLKYGIKPGIPTGQAYDATNIVLDLISVKQGATEILSKMKELTEYNGVSGRIIFTPDNKTILPTAIFEVNDGNIFRIQAVN